MNRSEEFLNEIRDIKSKMTHPWDEVFVVNLNEVGLWPSLKNQAVEVTNDNCNKDKLAELLLDRLSKLEPLFKNTSAAFKEQFKMTCGRCFCSHYFNERARTSQTLINWTEFFDQLNARIQFNAGSVHWSDENDIALWNKIDLSKKIQDELLDKLGTDYKKEFEKILKEEDPVFFGKIQKHKNSINQKAS